MIVQEVLRWDAQKAGVEYEWDVKEGLPVNDPSMPCWVAERESVRLSHRLTYFVRRDPDCRDGDFWSQCYCRVVSDC